MIEAGVVDHQRRVADKGEELVDDVGEQRLSVFRNSTDRP